VKTRRRRRQLELAAARAAAGAQVDDADKTLLRGQVLALQQHIALLTCPAASDAPPPAVSPLEHDGAEPPAGQLCICCPDSPAPPGCKCRPATTGIQ
jgi:hypothetical protein